MLCASSGTGFVAVQELKMSKTLWIIEMVTLFLLVILEILSIHFMRTVQILAENAAEQVILMAAGAMEEEAPPRESRPYYIATSPGMSSPLLVPITSTPRPRLVVVNPQGTPCLARLSDSRIPGSESPHSVTPLLSPPTAREVQRPADHHPNAQTPA
ncbi:hypothetical protein PAPYR_3029 [Paratrimastix pyriformis]|uniref:Uncharacterized protein n=1 Tax=Paratrimastix pyriformis TaxID=342808 RepID=A0ABQ8UNP3_9EUKA|nr:hypothetical protein PAPYR_3029 [Paratrimastix pyriformis]